MSDFEGRLVIVTGGTGALGTAVVGHLLDAGARVAIPAHTPKDLDRFEFADDPRVEAASGVDLTDEPAVKAFYGKHGPGLWSSIHVAGGFAMSSLADTSGDDFEKQMAMNARSCFLCCKHAAAMMGHADSSGGGRIVNVAARVGLMPELGGGMAAYTASKAAVVALTQALAAELKARRIWVNAVAPSIMDTPANRSAMPDADHDAWPKVAEVAETICFLASPRNRVSRAAVVPVYGQS